MIRRKQPHRAETFLWAFFLLWSATGLFIFVIGLERSTLSTWNFSPGIEPFVAGCLAWGDFVFMLLAALIVFLGSRRQIGTNRAFNVFALVVAASALVETLGTMTGFPFGDYQYLGNMGPQLGVLPLAIPLAWYCIIEGTLTAIRNLLPRAGAFLAALLAGSAAVLFDWILEPVAWQIRFYWTWEAGYIPVSNYLSWFVLSFGLAFLIRAVLAPSPPASIVWKPACTVGIMVVLFIGAQLLGN